MGPHGTGGLESQEGCRQMLCRKLPIHHKEHFLLFNQVNDAVEVRDNTTPMTYIPLVCDIQTRTWAHAA